MNYSAIAIACVIIVSFALAFWAYPLLPEKLAAHWNAQGEIDGYWGKTEALFFIPLLGLGLAALFLVIPRIDPLRKGFKEFRRQYDFFVIAIMLFLAYVQALTIAWNLGLEFGMMQFLAPAIGLLFYAAGVLIRNTKQNWFVGIRTPWTLSSERVWNKTHEKGAVLFKLSGLVAIFGAFLPSLAFWLIIAPVIVSAIALVAYSYLEFRKELRAKGPKRGRDGQSDNVAC